MARDGIYHIAHKVNPGGQVSPWCAKKPKALNLSRTSWTFDYARSNCEKCKAAYRECNRPDSEPPCGGKENGR